MSNEKCCFCPDVNADFEITTTRNSDAAAGPDPYCDLHYVCERHAISEVLTYQDGMERPEEVMWTIRPLDLKKP